MQAHASYVEGLVPKAAAYEGRSDSDALRGREQTQAGAFPCPEGRAGVADAPLESRKRAASGGDGEVIPEGPQGGGYEAARSASCTGDAPHESDEIGAKSNWTATLLAASSRSGLRAEASRFGAGIGLAALYGLALGARQGGASLVRHAVGVPAAMIAVACLGVPALTIVLTLFNAPISPSRALSAASRAAAASGLILGGLAPAAALFVVTSASTTAAAVMGLLGLAIGGVIGLRFLLRDLKSAMQGELRALTWAASSAALLGFAVFATALALRVWWSSLPILRGGAA